MIAYLDSSMLVKLFLDEPGSEIAREVWESRVLLATNRISHAELACALATAVWADRYQRGTVDPAVIDGTFLSENADLVEADAAVVDLAAAVGTRHSLHGMDAIHVASALQLADFGSILVSWDERQRRAARAEGLAVYPETVTAALR